jgi:NTE family protein
VALEAEGNPAMAAILAAGKPAAMRGAEFVELTSNGLSS